MELNNVKDEDFDCFECGLNTMNEYYMVKNSLWDKYGIIYGMLCVLCLEDRMGRRLKPKDFVNFPINHGVIGTSELLLKRLGLKPLWRKHFGKN